jgi:hypothetical protein
MDFPRYLFRLSDEKMISIAAFFQTLPDRLVEQAMR